MVNQPSYFYTFATQNNIYLKMKKLILLLTISIVFISCSKVGKDEYIITGSAKGYKDGTKIVLQTQDDKTMQPISVDSTTIKNGKFEMKGKIKEPKMHFLSLIESNTGVSLIVENGEIDVEIKKDSLQNSIVKGTYNNDEFNSFNDKMKVLQKKVQQFQKENSEAYNKASAANDTVTLNKINKGNKVIQDEYKKAFEDYASTHPKALISLFMIQSMFRYPDFDLEKVKKMYDKMDTELKNTTFGKKLNEQFLEKLAAKASKTKVKPEVGTIAPNFSAPSPSGKNISLKESLGKVTLIDFWASWCGPCRKENPNLVMLYNNFHTKGLNIIGVSLDNDATKWKDAIKLDNLNWIQISNLKQWQDPIAQMYSIEQIPSSFLLDEKGKIIAIDLRGQELQDKVKSILGN
jgi:thiol-disulfide isomerase/thioredoxin